MTRITILAAAAALLSAPAFAQDTEVTDTDGDGVFSMEELLVTYPTLTMETFEEIDANDDGAIDTEELTTAEESGMIAG